MDYRRPVNSLDICGSAFLLKESGSEFKMTADNEDTISTVGNSHEWQKIVRYL